MDARRRTLVVLELFSGIGGMHCALKESGIPFDVVAAIDINQISNSIYHHNFPRTKLRAKCLTTLTLSELESYSADLVTMSPPCQPFTRVGKQRDIADERTKSLLHFLDLLPKLSKIPSYILLENVKGFETSLTRDVTVKTLEKLDFVFQEFLLTPQQFSIPNSRLRYYLLAKRRSLTFNFKRQSDILKTLPTLTTELTTDNVGPQPPHNSSTTDTKTFHSMDSSNPTESRSTESFHNPDASGFHSLHRSQNFSGSGHDPSERPQLSPSSSEEVSCAPAEESSVVLPVARLLSEFFEDQPDEYFERYLLARKFLRYFWVMDLVERNSMNSCCFTKRYGHHIEGAGSVVQMKPSLRDLTEFRGASDATMVAECAEEVNALQLRFFTPREIANLLCFPQHFDFPDNVTTLQLYRALGNSINVHVVSCLLRLLLSGEEEEEEVFYTSVNVYHSSAAATA